MKILGNITELECPVPLLPVWICVRYIKKRENIWFFEMQDGRYHKIKLTDLIENCPSCGGAPIRWSGIRNKRRSTTAATLKCNRQGRGRCDYYNACRRAASRRRAEQLALAYVPTKPARTYYSNVVPFVDLMNAGFPKRASSGPYANDRLTVTGIDAIADTRSKECDIYQLAAAAAAVASATVGASKTASSDVKSIGTVKTASSAVKTEAAAATAVENVAASKTASSAVKTEAAAATAVETVPW